MLEIKKITKVYKTEGFEQKALDMVSVNFREHEFASILGPSGSGKTTFLNIIGGLDHYTSGDLIINGVSTKNYKDRDWDSYRNHRVGFVFQSYNLIGHQSILRNVELALTLSGVSKEERKQRAFLALSDVGLADHVGKRPNQLSGGQMQRVAIARALVNDPDIILADEPTGALDSDTSVQIMEVLKNISKNKLVIMVTHNPDLAMAYSSRIINIKDGKIVADSNPYNGKINTKKKKKEIIRDTKKTKMSFLTALTLSFNNLMMKKGRTVLVSFAGSIGIIGIALIQAVSTGFQNYVDSIGEDTLTSYPLTITEEAADFTSLLLSMTNGGGEKADDGKVLEQQYISSMVSNIRANDLKLFNNYLLNNYNNIKKDITNITYGYSIDPLIYTIDGSNEIAKINPNNLFTSIYGSNNMFSSYSNMTSVFSPMINNQEMLDNNYQVLAGKWPSNYDEMVIVLSEKGTISDLLVYSLGFRDTSELTKIIMSVMNGESSNIKHEPLTFTYEELMSKEYKLILPSDLYKYNDVYNIYEDMSQDNEYMNKLYNDSLSLKIVGVVTVKEGSNSMILSPGINYRTDLIKYISNKTYDSEIVKKQLENPDIDVFTNNRFDSNESNNEINFSDMISIDTELLNNMFNYDINYNSKYDNYMDEMKNALALSVSQEIINYRNNIINNFKELADSFFNDLGDEFTYQDIKDRVVEYINSEEVQMRIKKIADEIDVSIQNLNKCYQGLLMDLLEKYSEEYIHEDMTLEDINNLVIKIYNDCKDDIINEYTNGEILNAVVNNLVSSIIDNVMKSKLYEKMNELRQNMSREMVNDYGMDPNVIASAFKFNLTEDELVRVIGAMMNKSEVNFKTNLITLGYQDLEEPTYISFYFSSFDGKENFVKFLDNYNEEMKNNKQDDKVINYSDTTGILMDSVKTIVNAVSYVLIAFVSISLIVSSIMIGIITYISVFERTKEIGILRAIGASKANISSIFNAETFIVGLLSGLFGIGISYILIPIINTILHKYTGDIPLRAALDPSNAIILIVLSVILTLIGGLIPARAASKKDPVIALRSE